MLCENKPPAKQWAGRIILLFPATGDKSIRRLLGDQNGVNMNMEVALLPRCYQRKLDRGLTETTGAFIRLIQKWTAKAC